MVFEMEDKQLRADLLECNRTAIILPQYKCKTYARIALKRNNNKPISISKESYSDFHMHTVLVGFVPPYMIWRLRGIQQSALLEWWIEFIENSGNIPIYQSKEHQAPTMDGSIFVIFLVLISGLVISFVVYIIEERKLIVKIIQNLFLSLSLRCYKIVGLFKIKFSFA